MENKNNVSLVVAHNFKRVVGDIKIPKANGKIKKRTHWNFPPHLKRLKKIVKGKPVILGKKSLGLFKNGTLPTDDRIVLTKKRITFLIGCDIARNIHQAVDLAGNAEEIIVLGGLKVFKSFLNSEDIKLNRVYFTLIFNGFDGEKKFPNVSFIKDWNLLEKKTYKPEDMDHYSFLTYQRK